MRVTLNHTHAHTRTLTHTHTHTYSLTHSLTHSRTPTHTDARADGDGDLHPSEFVDLLNKRSTFGLNQKRFLGFTDFIACVRGCFGSSPAAADDPRYFAKSPQDTFAQFATVEHDGQLFMSPVDFMRSVTLSDGGAEQSDHVSVESPAYQFLLQFDHDNDGFISLHEYMFFSTLLAIPSQDLRVAFHMADTDGSGEVDAAEFLALVSSMSMQTGLGAALEARCSCGVVVVVVVVFGGWGS